MISLPPAEYKQFLRMELMGGLEPPTAVVKRSVTRGETVVVERGVDHSFSSETGCVFEEISTTHYVNDSFYAEADRFVDPRKTRVYLTEELLKGL